jgi:hypothetical protein
MPFPTAHALLIGIGSYAHAPQLNVPITAPDAAAVSTVLRDPQLCGYPPEQVALLSNAAARRDGVLTALDALAARAGEGDTVFVSGKCWQQRRARCRERCRWPCRRRRTGHRGGSLSCILPVAYASREVPDEPDAHDLR